MKLYNQGVWLIDGKIVENNEAGNQSEDRKKTIAWNILQKHNVKEDGENLHIKFDSLTSHDITYVGIIQTARASGMEKFPVPYVLTNCHNTLCAVGGTINEDDHQFALSAAKKYGGIYVPPCLAVIHSYNRECMTGCGRMILGSDSHTRYGALGTMGIGEGGGELAKQLVNRTYDIKTPEVVLIHLSGKPRPGVGPQDVALAIIAEVYANGFVKNKVMEFVGEGVSSLSQDYRNGIDVMTTETTCLSSIWQTDEITKKYFEDHHRENAYQPLAPENGAYYDACIEIDLAQIECMIALPMHPSYAVAIKELKKNPYVYLKEAEDRSNKQLGSKATMDLVSKIDENGNIHVDQGIIAGCSGGIFENIYIASKILENGSTGNDEFKLSVYPDSMPSYKALVDNGVVSNLVSTGAIFREAFCGPCFGAGDTPANGELSIRHTTRNFANREGSKPTEGQISSVALMDARSIAATAANQGVLTAADEILSEDIVVPECPFDEKIYDKRVYNGWNQANPQAELRFGPNIKDWPTMQALTDDVLIQIVSHIDDPVTTTDELIPSGETSSYRSNPLRLAEFTLSRKDPDYVQNAKAVQQTELERQNGNVSEEVMNVYNLLEASGVVLHMQRDAIGIGSAIYAKKPGDGSAREQAASCQRVLGANANFAQEYATKRYRSNCINWGILPFVTEDGEQLEKGSYVFLSGIRETLESGAEQVNAYVVKNDQTISKIDVKLGELSKEERKILLDGCLINYYKA